MRLDKLRSSYLPPSISLTHTCVGLHVAKLGFRTVEIDPVGRVTSAKGGGGGYPTYLAARWADGSNHSKSAGRAVRRAGTGRGRPPRRRPEENVAPCVPPHAIVGRGALLRSCQVEQVSEDGLGKQNVLRESEEKTTDFQLVILGTPGCVQSDVDLHDFVAHSMERAPRQVQSVRRRLRAAYIGAR